VEYVLHGAPWQVKRRGGRRGLLCSVSRVVEAEEDEEHGGAASDGDGWPRRRPWPWQSWMSHGYGRGVKETTPRLIRSVTKVSLGLVCARIDNN
jgi:hypothetical protein